MPEQKFKKQTKQNKKNRFSHLSLLTCYGNTLVFYFGWMVTFTPHISSKVKKKYKFVSPLQAITRHNIYNSSIDHWPWRNFDTLLSWSKFDTLFWFTFDTVLIHSKVYQIHFDTLKGVFNLLSNFDCLKCVSKFSQGIYNWPCISSSVFSYALYETWTRHSYWTAAE